MSMRLLRNHKIIGTVGVAASLGISYIVLRKVHQSFIIKYGGVVGVLRLIWLGDHLESHIRLSIDSLVEVREKYIDKELRRLQKIEIVIQTAKLNSVDHDQEPIDPTLPKHYILSQSPSLKKDLSLLSQNLDKIAARIDEVPSYNNVTVKNEKKTLSKLVVEMMEAADRYILECGFKH